MTRKTVTMRTADRLSRAAYDFEYLANRMKEAEGFESEAEAVRSISRLLGNLGRDLARRLSQEA